ncbi:hypothetical protein BsWGS_24539 [Bradybaena similaris]
MRLGVIAGLFGLSFALLFLCVDSQTPSCTSGWFGSGCKYKCRCVDDKCDVNGACTAPSKCQGGWFGPACQYSDLAYSQASPPEVTDGDDSTCNPITSITIPLNDTHFFTWMRVVISDEAPAALEKMAVTFFSNATPVNCDNLITYVVDKRTVDLHCSLTEEINQLTLNALEVSGLCSVYVSGDSYCDHKHYGRDCELNCSCQIPEACFVSTGGCPSGCPTGFQGAGCMMECPTGKFGANCSSSCSPNCMPTGVEGVSACEPGTGNCSKGCRAGFSGSSCLEASMEAISVREIKPIIIGVCLLLVAITIFGVCFCKKRKATPSAERKAASV